MHNVTRSYGLLEKFLAEKRCAMANKLIPDSLRGGRVLDIGCGTHPFFLLNTDFFEKHGVDQVVNKESREKFSKQKIKLYSFDINKNEALPFDDNYFDAVIMLAVIEHLKVNDLSRLLADIYRVLKPEGVYIYTTPSPWTHPLLKVMSCAGLLSQTEIKDHKDYYSHEKMKMILKESGFSTQKMKLGSFELNSNTWGVAQK